MLRARRIELLVDVRAFPASRAKPQFNKEALARALAGAGIGYEHMPALGGRRRGLGETSPNLAWKHPAFRAYADYMMTDEFWVALDSLLLNAGDRPSAIMCSETLWWRCHRRMIADAAIARGVRVLHLTRPGVVTEHMLPPFARLANGRVVYAGLSGP